MKVLEINVCSGCKSTGRIATDIAALLKKRGEEVVVAYGRDFSYRGIKTYRICSQTDVRIAAAISRVRDNAGFQNEKSTKRFIQWIEQYDPDVIHLHNLHGYYINIQLLFEYLKSANKKVVWTLHDCWAFTGHCTHFEYFGCEKWKTGCYDCGQKKAYPASLLKDRSEKNYLQKKELFTGVPNMTIVTPSQWLANLVKQSFLKEYPITVINNGVDLSVFKPTESQQKKEYNLTDKKIVLAVASPWDERKGLSDVLKIAEMLGEGFKTVIIGLNEKQIASIDSDAVLPLKRTNNVGELVRWYSAADVLINPTYEDNYPTVNLEAQACGTPVITYKTGGSSESVPDENTIEVGNAQGIAEMIRYRLSDLKLKKAQDSTVLYAKYLELFNAER